MASVAPEETARQFREGEKLPLNADHAAKTDL